MAATARKSFFTISVCLLLIWSMEPVLAFHQDSDGGDPDHIDFSGYIKKYDTTFKGIGPEVYFLPPPPTAEELLGQQYEEKQHETIAIPKMITKMEVLADLKPVGGLASDPRELTGPNQSIEGWLLLELERATQNKDISRMAHAQNMLGREYFRLGALTESLQFFEKALSLKTELKEQSDIMALNYNLATIHHYSEDLAAAQARYETTLQLARKQNDRTKQAEAMMRLALIKAKQGKYEEAEQDLIRTVLPMFRSLRNTTGDEGRITAYSVLADVYRLQKRYPEAQWFMLQAREIADEKKLNNHLPMILFALAEIKKSSGNKIVAINEYKMAEELVGEQADFLAMRLAIQDALGDIYHENGDFKEALEALNRYDSLKEQLMLVDFPF